jgi:hypothetical protein
LEQHYWFIPLLKKRRRRKEHPPPRRYGNRPNPIQTSYLLCIHGPNMHRPVVFPRVSALLGLLGKPKFCRLWNFTSDKFSLPN